MWAKILTPTSTPMSNMAKQCPYRQDTGDHGTLYIHESTTGRPTLKDL